MTVYVTARIGISLPLSQQMALGRDESTQEAKERAESYITDILQDAVMEFDLIKDFNIVETEVG